MCQWNKRGVEQSVRDRLLVERSFYMLPPPPLPSERAAPSWLRTRGHIEAEGTEEEGGVKGVTSDEWRGGGWARVSARPGTAPRISSALWLWKMLGCLWFFGFCSLCHFRCSKMKLWGCYSLRLFGC